MTEIGPVIALRPEYQDGAERAAEGALALGHLVACLRAGAAELRAGLADVDAAVIEAHVAQLLVGREWPGMPIAPFVGSDEQEPG